jgi:hypothetical protein
VIDRAFNRGSLSVVTYAIYRAIACIVQGKSSICEVISRANNVHSVGVFADGNTLTHERGKRN